MKFNIVAGGAIAVTTIGGASACIIHHQKKKKKEENLQFIINYVNKFYINDEYLPYMYLRFYASTNEYKGIMNDLKFIVDNSNVKNMYYAEKAMNILLTLPINSKNYNISNLYNLIHDIYLNMANSMDIK